MNKITKLFIDVDDTIIPSGEIICSLYNDKYKYHTDFKEAKFEECHIWTMTDVCPLLDQETMKDMFESDEFYEKAILFDGIKEMIDDFHFNVGLDIIFCSRGTPKNIAKKLKWIEKQFPYSTQLPIVGDWFKPIDKDMINMSGGIMIDDKKSNLDNCNAEHRILASYDGNFKKDWNINFEGFRADSVDNLRWIIGLILTERGYEENKNKSK